MRLGKKGAEIMKNREDNVKQLENKAKRWNHPQFKSPS